MVRKRKEWRNSSQPDQSQQPPDLKILDQINAGSDHGSVAKGSAKDLEVAGSGPVGCRFPFPPLPYQVYFLACPAPALRTMVRRQVQSHLHYAPWYADRSKVTCTTHHGTQTGPKSPALRTMVRRQVQSHLHYAPWYADRSKVTGCVFRVCTSCHITPLMSYDVT